MTIKQTPQGQAVVDVKFYNHHELLSVDEAEYKKLWDLFTKPRDSDPNLSEGMSLRPKRGTLKAKIDNYPEQKKQLLKLQKQINRRKEIYLLLRQLANHEMNPRCFQLPAPSLPSQGREEIHEYYDISEKADTEILDVDAPPVSGNKRWRPLKKARYTNGERRGGTSHLLPGRRLLPTIRHREQPPVQASYWFRFHLKTVGWKYLSDSGGAFIPGIFNEAGLTPNDVLEYGTEGVHYAKGYDGLFHMVEKYGVFKGFDESNRFRFLDDYDETKLEELKKQILDLRQASVTAMEPESSGAADESTLVVPETARGNLNTLEDEGSEQQNNKDSSEPTARHVSLDTEELVPEKTFKQKLDIVWELYHKVDGNPLFQQFCKDLVAVGEAPPQQFLDFLAFYNAMSAGEKKKLVPVVSMWE